MLLEYVFLYVIITGLSHSITVNKIWLSAKMHKFNIIHHLFIGICIFGNSSTPGRVPVTSASTTYLKHMSCKVSSVLYTAPLHKVLMPKSFSEGTGR